MMFDQSPCPRNDGNLTKPRAILFGTAEELSKLTKMITELFNSSRTHFENEKIEIVAKIISITNQSVNESIREIHKFRDESMRILNDFQQNVTLERKQLEGVIKDLIISITNQSVNESIREIHKFRDESMRTLNDFQQNVTLERKQLEGVIKDLFHQCQNESKIEILKLPPYIEKLVQSSQKSFVEEMGQSTENISNFINKFHIDLNDRMQILRNDMQTSFKTMQDQFVDETTDLGVQVASEVQTFRCMYRDSYF